MPSLGESMSDDQSKPGQRRTKMTDEERREKARARYQKNKDKVKAQSKKWKEDNKDKVDAYNEANREKQRLYMTKYREDNKELIQEKRDAIKDQRSERQRNYYHSLSPERKKVIKERSKRYIANMSPEKRSELNKKQREAHRKKRERYLKENPEELTRECVDCSGMFSKRRESRGRWPKRCYPCADVYRGDKEALSAWRLANKDKLKYSRNSYQESRNGMHRIMIASVRGRAKKKGMDFDLTLEWIKDRIKKSKETCEATGYPYNYTYKIKRSRPFAPSVHRADPNKGYTKYNCLIVCWAWNRAVGDGTDGIMQTLLNAYVEKQRNDSKMLTIKSRESQGKLWGKLG
jgi:hypothetical protein